MTNLKDKIAQIRLWCQEDPNLWELITGSTRGPDAPSERQSMGSAEHDAAYAGRRARKAQTIEVLRGLIWGPLGPARTRTDRNYVILPPVEDRDHFDRHVARAVGAAKAAGIDIEIRVEGASKLAPNQRVIPLAKPAPPQPKKPPTNAFNISYFESQIAYLEKKIKQDTASIKQYTAAGMINHAKAYAAGIDIFKKKILEYKHKIAVFKAQDEAALKAAKAAEQSTTDTGWIPAEPPVFEEDEEVTCEDCGGNPCECEEL